ncbi:FAD dependent oxidoreductase [Dendrothele bispora CBS 962.96]|uniref:FAD dependent oxidoreductase n=1 Tax=Dendrothele bispora (strain CBS 962.96) TaxID=1314807 RepID=A0A4S8LYE3_DENBC|nr:FAD dependent oxidoreductase [Dendrothele bispora CBS 962.96]
MSAFRVPTRHLQFVNSAFTLPGLQKSPSLPVSNPTKSFWLDSAPDVNPLANEGSKGPLTQDADICIIGSGITGVSAAYHMSKIIAERPTETTFKVVILEARDFCSGATGRNGGHLCPAVFLDFKYFESKYGTEEAIKSLAIENYTVDSILRYIAEENFTDEVDLVAGGHITLFVTEEEYAEAQADFEAAKKAGLPLNDVEWISKEDMHAYGVDFPGASLATKGHNLWPLKLVTRLYNSAKSHTSRLSLDLHTRTPVTSIESLQEARDDNPTTSTRRWKLNTPRGFISTSYVFHATNAYTGYLLPHMHGPQGIVPTRGQVIALRAARPLQDLTKKAWYANEGFEYWFPRPMKLGEEFPLCILGGGRSAAGPTFEWFESDDGMYNEDAGKALRACLPDLFPGRYEEGREPEMEWTGIMGFTKMKDPFVGPVLENSLGTSDKFKGQYVSVGYSGHGMPRAFSCALIVSSMIIAEMFEETWEAPAWLPERYLTTKRHAFEH